MTVRKDFTVLPHINSLIRHACEAGLIQKWDRDSQLYEKRKREPFGNVRLSLVHLASCIITLLVGLSLGILSFICEIQIFKYLKRTQFMHTNRVWIFVEKLIFRQERYFFVRKFET